MNQPVLHTPTWTVWTTDRIHGPGFVNRASWCWAAHGPRGSESGIEETAEGAAQKAYAAMILLSDPERQGATA